MKQDLHINIDQIFWDYDENGEYKLLYPEGKPTGKIEVALPHSCDEWVFVNDTPDKCIEVMDNFIEEIEEIKKEIVKIKLTIDNS